MADTPGSPITKEKTNDAIPTFASLASSKDVETLRSMLDGLAKLAKKGWQFQIHNSGGSQISASNLAHSHPRVHSKALELLHYLTEEPETHPDLVGIVPLVVKFTEEQRKKVDLGEECLKQSLYGLSNLACAEDEDIQIAVIEANGAQALVANLPTTLHTEIPSEEQPRDAVARGLASLSRGFGFHPLLLNTALVVRVLTMLQDPETSPEALADGVCILANLADNESCHIELQRAGAMQVLVVMEYDENPRLRREVGRAISNLCRVLDNQRALLNYKSVWALFAELALSSDPFDEAVAADFYLYISENETLPEVLRFCDIPADPHMAEPLTALGQTSELTTQQKAAVSLANLATITPFVLLPDPTLKLLTEWLDSSDEIIQREAIRALGALCEGNPEFVSIVLQKCLDYGALKPLGALVTLDEVVLKCESIKILACMFKEKDCHGRVLDNDGLHKMLTLALSRDFAVKAEAVNSIGNLYANVDCHQSLVEHGGLGVAMSMATSDDALVAQKGIRMHDTLAASPTAHVPLVQIGALRRYRDLAMDCSEALQASIAAGFLAITSNPDALLYMCGKVPPTCTIW
jgi:hypothetical protein